MPPKRVWIVLGTWFCVSKLGVVFEDGWQEVEEEGKEEDEVEIK